MPPSPGRIWARSSRRTPGDDLSQLAPQSVGRVASFGIVDDASDNQRLVATAAIGAKRIEVGEPDVYQAGTRKLRQGGTDATQPTTNSPGVMSTK